MKSQPYCPQCDGVNFEIIYGSKVSQIECVCISCWHSYYLQDLPTSLLHPDGNPVD